MNFDKNIKYVFFSDHMWVTVREVNLDLFARGCATKVRRAIVYCWLVVGIPLFFINF